MISSAPLMMHERLRQTCSMYLPTGSPEKQRVERDRRFDHRERQVEQSRPRPHRFGRDVAFVFLKEMQRSAAARCAFSDRVAISRSALRLRACAQNFGEVARLERAVHRSTSPKTGSSEPIITTMSAIKFAERDLLEHLQVVHRRRTRAHAPRAVVAVRNDVVAELAARTLDRLVHVAGRNAEALADDLEVVDQRFHRERDRLFRRRRDLRVVDHHRARRVEPLAHLPDDAHRLVHLVEPHQEARVGIAFGARRHVELVLSRSR